MLGLHLHTDSVAKEKGRCTLQSTHTKEFTACKDDRIHEDAYVKARLNFAVPVTYAENERR